MHVLISIYSSLFFLKNFQALYTNFVEGKAISLFTFMSLSYLKEITVAGFF